MEQILMTIPKSELEQLIESAVERCLQRHQSDKKVDEWMTVDQLRNYLPSKPSKQTIYFWTHKGLIPFNKKTKHLTFSKSEIDQWLSEGGQTNTQQILNDVNRTLSNLKK